jgi:hypothetical protein
MPRGVKRKAAEVARRASIEEEGGSAAAELLFRGVVVWKYL